MTVRAIGPAVSWLCEIGMIPLRLTRPTVGFSPTSPFDDDGQTTEPSVSVPTPTAAKFAATAAPVPVLEPHALRFSAYGLRVSPPRPLQPLLECVDRKFAHSLRFVLPRITAPASRSRFTTCASRNAIDSASASEPAVVRIRSAVSMLSLITIGIPCIGPRVRPALRSRSSISAVASASGFNSIIALIAGPRLSIASIRAR